MSETANFSSDAAVVSAQGYRVPRMCGSQMYSALLVGRDSNVYMALCNDCRPAYLVRLAPRTGAVEVLGNMQDVTGEHDPEQIPQSKIHTQLIEDSRGRIWFGTHSEELYNEIIGGLEIYPKGYPGGHIIRFDPQTGKFKDFGIQFPRKCEYPKTFDECGLYYLAMTKDPERDILYAMLGDKMHIASFNMTAGAVLDCQPVPLPYPYVVRPGERGNGYKQCRDLRVGADGNVYTFTNKGQLIRYLPVEKRVELLDLWVPGGNKVLENMPYALVITRDRARIYGNGSLSGNLFELTVERGGKPAIRDLGIPFHFLPDERVIHAIVMAQDGMIYFIGSSPTAAMFYSYDPASNQTKCWGTIVFHNLHDAVPRRAWGACAAPDGTLWFGGNVFPGKDGEFKPSRSFFAIKP